MPTIWIDVTFVDVTEPLRAVQHAGDTSVANASARRHAFWLKPLKREYPTSKGLADVAANSGSRLRVFEYTAGTPSAWAVLIPPDFPTDVETVSYLTYFRPSIEQYRNPSEVNLERVFRYWRNPPVGFPWFIGPDPPPSADATSMPPMTSLPNPCGWLHQLFRAQLMLRQQGRTAPIILNPVPDGSSYGVSGSYSGLCYLTTAMSRILRATKELSTRIGFSSRPRSLGICGFSAGGQALFDVLAEYLAWRNPPVPLRELYAFDPNGFAQAGIQLQRWFQQAQDHQLRMFAGNQLPAMLALIRQLRAVPAAQSRVSVHPTSARFWTGQPYLSAGAEPLHMRPGRSPYQQYNEDPPDGWRPSDIRVDGLRHQWAVGGGEGDPARDANFIGYFQMALEASRF